MPGILIIRNLQNNAWQNIRKDILLPYTGLCIWLTIQIAQPYVAFNNIAATVAQQTVKQVVRHCTKNILKCVIFLLILKLAKKAVDIYQLIEYLAENGIKYKPAFKN